MKFSGRAKVDSHSAAQPSQSPDVENISLEVHMFSDILTQYELSTFFVLFLFLRVWLCVFTYRDSFVRDIAHQCPRVLRIALGMFLKY